MRPLILCLDTYGDITLRQPLLHSLAERSERTCLVMRAAYQDLMPYLGIRAEIEICDVDPYAPDPPLAETRAALEELKSRIRAFAPTVIVSPLFNPTFVDEWLLRSMTDLRRVGLVGQAPARSAIDRMCPELATGLDASFERMLTDVVQVDEASHEGEKYQRLHAALFGAGPALGRPRLHVGDAEVLAARYAADALALEPGRFAVAACAGTANVELKAPPVEVSAAAIVRLENRHGLRSLLVGVESERELLARVARAAEESGARPATWIGDRGSIGTLLSLIDQSAAYFGADTGVMHFAAALDKPVLAFFGGGHFPRFMPAAAKSIVACVELPCYGCHWECKWPQPVCLSTMTGDAAVAAVDALMEPFEGMRYVPGTSRQVHGSVAALVGHAMAEQRALSERISFISAALTRAERDAADRLQLLGSAEVQIKESEEDRHARGRQISELSKRVEELNREAADRQRLLDQVERLQNELRQLEVRLGESNTALSLREARIRRLEALLAQVNGMAADLRRARAGAMGLNIIRGIGWTKLHELVQMAAGLQEEFAAHEGADANRG